MSKEELRAPRGFTQLARVAWAVLCLVYAYVTFVAGATYFAIAFSLVALLWLNNIRLYWKGGHYFFSERTDAI